MTLAKNSEGSGYDLRGLQGEVIHDLGMDIVSGVHQPGAVLPKEAELEAQYGVSRTLIREAMRVLAAKGLVEIRRRYGTRVRPRNLWSFFDGDILRWHVEAGIGDEVLLHLVEVRQLLEPGSARYAAARADLEDLERIDQACREMLRISESTQDLEDYAAADIEFHLAVSAASHNTILAAFGRLVADGVSVAFQLQQTAALPAGGTLQEDAEAHRSVFEAINRNDAEQAAAAMLDVVLDGKRALIKALNEEERGKKES